MSGGCKRQKFGAEQTRATPAFFGMHPADAKPLPMRLTIEVDVQNAVRTDG